MSKSRAGATRTALVLGKKEPVAINDQSTEMGSPISSNSVRDESVYNACNFFHSPQDGGEVLVVLIS